MLDKVLFCEQGVISEFGCWVVEIFNYFVEEERIPPFLSEAERPLDLAELDLGERLDWVLFNFVLEGDLQVKFGGHQSYRLDWSRLQIDSMGGWNK